MRFGRLFIKSLSLSHLNGQGSNGAFPYACAQTITKPIANHSGFSIYDLYSTFRTGNHTVAAAVA
jgi:hypothetical protein